MAETFNDFRHLPESLKAHVMALEIFVGDMDGKTLCTPSSDNTFIDDGTVDAEEAVKSVNALVAEVDKLRAALWPFAMKYQIGAGYCPDDFKRASEAMGELPVRI